MDIRWATIGLQRGEENRIVSDMVNIGAGWVLP